MVNPNTPVASAVGGGYITAGGQRVFGSPNIPGRNKSSGGNSKSKSPTPTTASTDPDKIKEELDAIAKQNQAKQAQQNLSEREKAIAKYGKGAAKEASHLFEAGSREPIRSASQEVFPTGYTPVGSAIGGGTLVQTPSGKTEAFYPVASSIGGGVIYATRNQEKNVAPPRQPYEGLTPGQANIAGIKSSAQNFVKPQNLLLTGATIAGGIGLDIATGGLATPFLVAGFVAYESAKTGQALAIKNTNERAYKLGQVEFDVGVAALGSAGARTASSFRIPKGEYVFEPKSSELSPIFSASNDNIFLAGQFGKPNTIASNVKIASYGSIENTGPGSYKLTGIREIDTTKLVVPEKGPIRFESANVKTPFETLVSEGQADILLNPRGTNPNLGTSPTSSLIDTSTPYGDSSYAASSKSVNDFLSQGVLGPRSQSKVIEGQDFTFKVGETQPVGRVFGPDSNIPLAEARGGIFETISGKGSKINVFEPETAFFSVKLPSQEPIGTTIFGKGTSSKPGTIQTSFTENLLGGGIASTTKISSASTPSIYTTPQSKFPTIVGGAGGLLAESDFAFSGFKFYGGITGGAILDNDVFSPRAKPQSGFTPEVFKTDFISGILDNTPQKTRQGTRGISVFNNSLSTGIGQTQNPFQIPGQTVTTGTIISQRNSIETALSNTNDNPFVPLAPFGFTPFDFSVGFPGLGVPGLGFPSFSSPRIRSSRKFKRIPSLVSFELNLKESRARRGEESGLVVRPIIGKKGKGRRAFASLI